MPPRYRDPRQVYGIFLRECPFHMPRMDGLEKYKGKDGERKGTWKKSRKTIRSISKGSINKLLFLLYFDLEDQVETVN